MKTKTTIFVRICALWIAAIDTQTLSDEESEVAAEWEQSVVR